MLELLSCLSESILPVLVSMSKMLRLSFNRAVVPGRGNAEGEFHGEAKQIFLNFFKADLGVLIWFR